MQYIHIKLKISCLYLCVFSLVYISSKQAFSQDITSNYTNSKKFISINQSENLANSSNTSKLVTSTNITSRQNIINTNSDNSNNYFVPKPTIASQRANIIGYSNQSYKRTLPTQNIIPNKINPNENINSEKELKSIVEANKPKYNQIQYQQTQQMHQNSYQEAVIPFIVDSVQYKPNNYANIQFSNNINTSIQKISYSPNSYNNTSVNNTSREDWGNEGVISNFNAVQNSYNKSSVNNSSTGLSALNLLNNAKQLLGVPYKYGGNTPVDGLDCSGFVRYVFYYTLGIVLPRRSEEIGQVGAYIESSSLKAGDLVFFNTRGARLSHLGIYMGNGQFIHSPSTGSNIRIDKLSNKYWATRYNGAKRIAYLN